MESPLKDIDEGLKSIRQGVPKLVRWLGTIHPVWTVALFLGINLTYAVRGLVAFWKAKADVLAVAARPILVTTVLLFVISWPLAFAAAVLLHRAKPSAQGAEALGEKTKRGL